MLVQTADMLTMDYADYGNPAVIVNSPAESDSTSMDYAYFGNPYVLVYQSQTSTVTINSNFFMFFMQ